MEGFYQAAATVLLTVIVVLTLDGQSRITALLLTMTVCAMVLAAGLRFLEPVLDFLKTLSALTGLENEILAIVFKVLGISVVTEISVLICNDAGHSSLGKAMQLLSNGTILWLALPLFQALTELLQKLMEAI